MKYLKKFASLALALVMVLALAAPAFAADPKTVTITIENSSGHQFVAYQIFEAANKDDASLDLTDVKWGQYVTDAGKDAIIDALKKAFPGTPETETASAVPGIFDSASKDNPTGLATIISNNFTGNGTYANAAGLKKLAEAIGGKVDPATPTAISSGTPFSDVAGTDNKSAGVTTGWVLITEKKNNNDTAPVYMLQQTTKNQTITRKPENSKVLKEVWDPKKPGGEGWSDAAIYPAGSNEIKFQLTVTLPDDLIKTYKEGNKAYNIVLHDVQAAALSNVQITSVVMKNAAGSTDLLTLEQNTNYFYVSGPQTHNGTDGPQNKTCSFEISIPNAEKLTNAQDSAKIVVNYTADLSETPTTGFDGNLNHVELWANGYVGESEVKVYALELKVNKVGPDNQPLAGAVFTLYKADQWDEAKNEPKENATGITMDQVAEGTEGEGENAVTWPLGSRFSYNKLEVGTYYLVESRTPENNAYTAITPIKIVVTASTTETPGTEAGTLSYTITADKFDETGVATIQNVKGNLLPNTGGIGTTIFYIAGGVLLVGAVVLLIAKRRTSADDE